MKRALLALLLGLALPAHADVWQRAIEGADTTKDRYDAELAAGDELVMRANAKGQSTKQVTLLVDKAIASYKAAAAIRTDQGEPWFRIANVIQNFYTDCEGGFGNPATCPRQHAVDIARAKENVEAWDAFEARAPLDPRLGEVLFQRAILRTKLVTASKGAKQYLEGAKNDYVALLDRADGLTMIQLEQVWGNLAETYMMLGKLEEAIETYSIAIEKGANSSTYYGKAVALDRDERTSEALEIIRDQGMRAFQDFQMQFAVNDVFYVPKGEEFYYFALINEAFGYIPESIKNWRLFIASGAHPQFHARAKAHLDALLIKQKQNPRPPQRDIFEVFP